MAHLLLASVLSTATTCFLQWDEFSPRDCLLGTGISPCRMGEYPHYSTTFHDVKVTLYVVKYAICHIYVTIMGEFPHSSQVIWRFFIPSQSLFDTRFPLWYSQFDFYRFFTFWRRE